MVYPMTATALKNYSMIDTTRAGDDSQHRDGRPNRQVRVHVRAPSLSAAAEAMGVTRYALTRWGGETWNAQTVGWLDAHEPGTVLISGVDHGGTVKDGQEVAVR